MALLARAPNAAIAGLWVSMLEAAGIPAHVPGQYLTDEWAATQRIVGNVGADVFVPRERLEEARRVIERDAAAAASAEESAGSGEADGGLDESPESEHETRAVAGAPAAEDPGAATTPVDRRAIWIEIAAVCGILVIPGWVSIAGGLFERHLRPWGLSWSMSDAFVSLGYFIPEIVLVRWVMWRSGAPASEYGWVRLRPVRDLLLGVAVLLAFVLSSGLFAYLVMPDSDAPATSDADAFLRGVKEGTEAPAGPAEWIVFVVFCLVIGLVEELSMRGYLATRLRHLAFSRSGAALVSSAVWSASHLYQGLMPCVLHLFQGLFLAWAFFALKRLWPLVIAHAGFDILLPLARDSLAQ
jgi:membrane protease YdiL (CAAX protease family)